MLAGAYAQLDTAGIRPDSIYQKPGAAVISKLLEKGSLSQNDYITLAGREVGEKLLETNVFAFHFDSKQVTFRSTLMKRYCEEVMSGQRGYMAG